MYWRRHCFVVLLVGFALAGAVSASLYLTRAQAQQSGREQAERFMSELMAGYARPLPISRSKISTERKEACPISAGP
jgi:hypothetical protein